MTRRITKSKASGQSNVQRYCNAKRKNGTRCRLRAGWSTSHPGTGPCRYHGGQLPNVRKHHARAEAARYVEGQLGHLPDIGPLEASLLAVRMAASLAAFWATQVEQANEGGQPPGAMLVEGYRQASLDLARTSKLAIDAGVAERQVRLAERMGERLSLALEEALATTEMTPKQRAKLVGTFAASLRRLEDAPIEGRLSDEHPPGNGGAGQGQ